MATKSLGRWSFKQEAQYVPPRRSLPSRSSRVGMSINTTSERPQTMQESPRAVAGIIGLPSS